MTTSLRVQIEVAEALLSSAVADTYAVELEDMRSTLQLVHRYEADVRALIRQKLQEERTEALKEHPAVSAVLEAFPGAEIDGGDPEGVPYG